MMSAVEKIGEFNKFGSVLGLERIQELLKRLENLQKDLKIIHVAGTNGKGSVCRFIYRVLREAGYSVGIYSSPYLEVFNERIECNEKYITDEELEFYSDRASKVAREICNEGVLAPTEFDVVTAVAMMYFADKNPDFVILEVGLGGIADSTNVIENPLATVISSVSMDHMDRLGNTIEEIANEKAGIVKEGVPLISGVTDKRAKDVIKNKAAEKHAPFIDTTENNFEIIEEGLDGSLVNFEVLGEKFSNLKISMVGLHQVRNAIVAVATLEVLSKNGIITISYNEMKRGILKAKNPGRFEVIKTDPLVILDGAHNEDGVKSFVETVKHDLKGKRLLTISGMLKDKDYEAMLTSLKELDADFVATEPNNPRKLDKEELAKMMSESGLNVVAAKTPMECVSYVNSHIDNYDAVLFVGSLYLIGEIRRIFNVC